MRKIIPAKMLVAVVTGAVLIASIDLAGADTFRASSSHELQNRIAKLNSNRNTRGDKLTIILEIPASDTESPSTVARHGGNIRYRRGNKYEIDIPARDLPALLNTLPETTHARLSYPHQELVETSQGVAISGAADMQSLSNAGQGIKVGIIDLGFASYTSAQASGDLPLLLHITDYSGTGTGGSSHGTNVAEIVHDMAPQAELYLAKVATDVQLEQAASDMIAAGVRVINHSVAWFGAAFYDGTGPLCDITNMAEAAGVQWVNAAGNSRTMHYLGNFTDNDNDRRHEFATGVNTVTVNANAGSNFSLILNWDAYPTTSINYDLFLYDGNPDAGGNLVASSSYRQNGSLYSTPYEAINYTPVFTGTHYIVVAKASNNTSHVPLTLFSTGPGLSVPVTASSLPQPGDCYNVLTVGATNLDDQVEGFSSQGPTTDGRDKPDITAPNRVATSLNPSFAGSSAAAPHASGAAALLLSQDPSLTTGQLRNLIIANAHDVYTSGYDYRTGYGRISLDADEDTYNHDDDNCVLVANIDQADLDNDGLGDSCDDDIDGDNLSNVQEIVLGSDPLNPDSDADTILDGVDNCLLTPNSDQADANNNGTGDACEPPMVTGVWSDSVQVGSAVFVFGANFDMSNTQVTINGINAPLVQIVSTDMLVFLLPDGNVNGPVTVTTPNGSATSVTNFGDVLAGLNITGIWPEQVTTGDFVFVFGSGFANPDTQVNVNLQNIPLVQVVSESMLIFQVPANMGSGAVQLTTPLGTINSVTLLNYTP